MPSESVPEPQACAVPTPKQLAAPGSRLVAIDGLRGIAASTVAFSHFFNALHPTASPFPYFLDVGMRHGDLGVEIFFVISGFVIAYSLRNRTMVPMVLPSFALRRAIRLDPPYWAVIGLTIVANAITLQVIENSSVKIPEVTDVLVNMFYLPDLLETYRIVTVAWTLCLEVQFYLFFVALLIAIRWLTKSDRVDSPTAAIIMTAFFVWSLLEEAEIVNIAIPGLFLERWYMFFMGAAVCWALMGRVSTWWYYGATVATLLIAIYGQRLDSTVVLLTALFCFVEGRRGRLITSLGGRRIQFLGKLSYSLYLLHPLVGNRALRAYVRFYGSPGIIETMGLIAVAFATTLAVSWVAYRVLERPFVRLSHRLGRRLSG